MVMNKITILDFLRSHKDEMHEKFGLIKIGLFGSYVRGEQRENSDIDLVVEIESSNKFRSFFGLKAYLENGLQKRIDLGIESSLKPVVHEYVEKEIVYA
jgi:predicted nucleotidyltransferase